MRGGPADGKKFTAPDSQAIMMGDAYIVLIPGESVPGDLFPPMRTVLYRCAGRLEEDLYVYTESGYLE